MNTKNRLFWQAAFHGVVTLLICTMAGCTRYTLQDAYVQGTPHQGMPNVTVDQQPGTVEIRSAIAINNRDQVNGRLDRSADNAELEWDLPPVAGNMRVDFTLSNHWAASMGINLANINEQSYWGGSMGLGFFHEDEDMGWRIDAGVQFQDMAYELRFLEEPHNGSSRYVYSDGRSMYSDAFAMITLNSKRKEWPLNIMFSAGFGGQTFYDTRGDNSVVVNDFVPQSKFKNNYFFWIPGVYTRVGELGRVMIGARLINDEISRSSGIRSELLLQFDWRLTRPPGKRS